jgi:hypothetical protein
MKTLHTLYHLTRADFLERIRRNSFLTVLALTVWAGYLFVPPGGAGYLVLNVGLRRGVYDSAWIGLMFGLIAAMHLPLFGFYLVKNAVARDRQTGVGQIIATTPIGKLAYVIGKWLSNLAVLVLILSVMTVMAAVMQLIRAEATAVNLWALITPIWLMGLPVLAIAAAMAVLFESISFLRGTLGNVAYFFVWGVILATVLEGGIDEATGLAQPFDDIFGYTRQLADIQQQVLAVDPDATMSSGLITPIRGRDVGTFVWDGVDWTVSVVRERMRWAGLALAIALASAIPFDRFDPARSGRGTGGPLGAERERLVSRLHRWMEAVRGGAFPRRQAGEASGIRVATVAHLTPLAVRLGRGRFFGVLVAELKLMLRGHSLIWYAGAIGLIIACLVSPLDDVRQYLLPAIWLWPMLIGSQMGIRERRYNTGQMVFSTPQPVWRQLPATWLAGVILTVIAGSGAWIRLAMVGEITGLLAWFVGAVFAPSLALALGVWVGNSRAFELIYALLWYIGVVNQVPAFDYAGVTAEGLAMGMSAVYLGITAGLVVLAVIGRWRQIRS